MVLFGVSSLTSIIIPNRITNIGFLSFSNCSALTDVYVEWSEPLSIPESAFSQVLTANVNLHVPEGAQCTYQNASVWQDFRIMGLPLTITPSVGIGGTISPSGTISVNCGTTQTFTITPDECYEIDQVLINGVNNPEAVAAGAYTFTNITENQTIEVTFKIKTYTITTEVAPLDGGTVSGAGTFDCGTMIPLCVTPDANYEFINWTVDDVEVSAELCYTFTISESRTLIANLKNILGIEAVETSGIKIYPNPTTGQLKIENGELKINNVEIFDVYGRNIHSLTPSLPHITINISHLQSGIYFVRVVFEGGSSIEKLVKQ